MPRKGSTTAGAGSSPPAPVERNLLAQFDLFAARSAAVVPAPPPVPVVAEPALVVREPAPVPVVVEPVVPAGPRVLTVAELTREIKASLEQRYQRVAVTGEISNLQRAASGHVYFTLKDEGATLSAVLFRNQARLLRFELANGQKVVCKGRVTLYEPRGQYQLACDTLEPTGLGALAVAFEQLKARLASEGLFDAGRKRVVPLLPRRIGVVTSPQGAAIRDFLRVLHQRHPNLPVLIAGARVQGEGAGAEVAGALERLCAWSAAQPAGEGLDVVLLTRGGGSIEDLWAFNEEVLARAIAASPIPVVSAVGHEVDFTIADFVADLRCPTPTAAAERLAPEWVKEVEQLAVRRRRLHKGMERVTAEARGRLAAYRAELGDPRRHLADARLGLDQRANAMAEALRARLAKDQKALAAAKERVQHAHPRDRLVRHERRLRELEARLSAAMARATQSSTKDLGGLRERLLATAPTDAILRARNALDAQRARLGEAQRAQLAARRAHFANQQGRLGALSPLQVLGRGYAIAFDEAGNALRGAQSVKPGANVSVLLADEHELVARVEQVRHRRR